MPARTRKAPAAVPVQDAHTVARLARHRAGELVGSSAAPRVYPDTLMTLADAIDAIADHAYQMELALHAVIRGEHPGGCCWRCKRDARAAIEFRPARRRHR